MDEFVRIHPSCIARGFSDLVELERDGDAAVVIFHEINYFSSKFLTTMVGSHSRIKVQLHEAVLLYNLFTVSPEGLTPPDSIESLRIHATSEQHIHIRSIFDRSFSISVA